MAMSSRSHMNKKHRKGTWRINLHWP